MENANLGLLISSPKYSFGTPRKNTNSCPSISTCITRRGNNTTSRSSTTRSGFSVFAHSATNKPSSSLRIPRFVRQTNQAEHFASISSSSSQETSSVGNPQLAVPPPSSNIGSPLFWIGVGVGLSALFSWVASYLKKYAMQQAFKTMMGQMNPQSNQFNNATFPPGSPFPFPMPSPPPSTSSPSPAGSRSATMDITASSVEAAPSRTDAKAESSATEVQPEPSIGTKDEAEVKKEPKKYAFVDVSPEETEQKSPFESSSDYNDTSSPKFSQSAEEVPQNGAASNQGFGASEGSQSTGKRSPGLSVEALEKMMEDPTVQKMVYPYLPEEMRNPTTFKWMLQNPQYRQQLEDMLNSMSGNAEWDNRLMDQLKNFDFNSPEVKQQFDQIGLTPEEVITKIMANPDVAMAFQNPRVQQAIMDCSQNPMSIAKYQNDKEVMDVFNKISQLFPGSAGPF